MLIDRITEAAAGNISGIKDFADAPVYLGIESLAQLGAYHVRFLTRFERHAFLLKITRCKMPEEEVLNGRYFLYGTLIHKSESAFAYKLQAKKENETCIEGEFLYATVDYSSAFKKEILQDHYRKVFSCLQNDIKTD
ncbi:MAG: hypothetical protein IMF10_09745 [Proteobacteria bacterium]|nr:hypothetical protein [Pseudomonadota bacterium]